jgi:hypothetical protein
MTSKTLAFLPLPPPGLPSFPWTQKEKWLRQEWQQQQQQQLLAKRRYLLAWSADSL